MSTHTLAHVHPRHHARACGQRAAGHRGGTAPWPPCTRRGRASAAAALRPSAPTVNAAEAWREDARSTHADETRVLLTAATDRADGPLPAAAARPDRRGAAPPPAAAGCSTPAPPADRPHSSAAALGGGVCLSAQAGSARTLASARFRCTAARSSWPAHGARRRARAAMAVATAATAMHSFASRANRAHLQRRRAGPARSGTRSPAAGARRPARALRAAT